MNANERKSETGQAPLTGESARLLRRRFLGLLGALGLFPIAVVGPPFSPAERRGSGSQAQAVGPLERTLREADFYRPHDLAG